jgi:hypothetical protein
MRGPGVDIGIVRNNTTAYIAPGADVHAAKDIFVLAVSNKTFNSFVGGAGYLERHEAAVGGHDGVRGLPALVVVERGEAGEIVAGAVEAQLPDVDVAEAGGVAEGARLVVALDAGVAAAGEDALDLVVEADRRRVVEACTRGEVDRPDARAAFGLVAALGMAFFRRPKNSCRLRKLARSPKPRDWWSLSTQAWRPSGKMPSTSL